MFLIRLLNISQEGFRLLWYWLWQRKRDSFDGLFAVRIRKSFERLGPTFMKLGQMSSLRPDFFPKVYCEELERCLDQGPVLPKETIRKLVTSQIKKNIKDVFSEFDDQPLAAASLSQVHRAKLHDGTEVVVKILRPNARAIVKYDLKILNLISFFMRKFYHHREQIDFDSVLERLRFWLLNELDFKQEVKNMKVMKRELVQFDQLVMPVVHEDYSTRSLIVMDYIEGDSLRKLMKCKRNNKMPEYSFSLDEKLVTLSHMLITMSMENGHFHADLHPANIIITPEGKIGLVDFGSIDYFDRNTRQDVLFFFLGIIFTEPTYLIRAVKSFSTQTKEIDEARFFHDINELCDRHRGVKTKEMSMSQLFLEGIEIALRHGFSVPWSVLLFVRTSMNLDGTLLKLMPDFSVSEHITKHLLKIYLNHRYSEITSLPLLLDRFEELYQNVKKVPEVLIRSVDALIDFLDTMKETKGENK